MHTTPFTASTATIETPSVPLKRLALSQGEVAYRQIGNGPPLILLHGWATSSRFWTLTLAQLADIRSCYALDMPGFGESAALTEATTIARLASVVIEFADKLGLERFDLDTHSFGAAVGIYIAAHWPERVRHLVLTSYGILHDFDDPLYQWARVWLQMHQIFWQPIYNYVNPFFRIAQPFSQALLNLSPFPQFLELLLFARPFATNNIAYDDLADVTRMDIRAHIGCLLSSSDPDLISAIPLVKAKTLLICGCDDRLVPTGGAAKLQAMIPHSQLLMIDSCGHVPVFEHADLYCQTVRRFLSEDS